MVAWIGKLASPYHLVVGSLGTKHALAEILLGVHQASVLRTGHDCEFGKAASGALRNLVRDFVHSWVRPRGRNWAECARLRVGPRSKLLEPPFSRQQLLRQAALEVALRRQQFFELDDVLV